MKTALPPRRLAALVGPVCLTAIGVVGVAIHSVVTGPLDAALLASLAGFLAALMLAERYPVPIEGVDVGGVTLSFVFGVAAAVLFGWAAATVIVFAATLTVHTLQHRPPLRVAFNTAVFALATAAGGIAISPINGESLAASVGAVALCAFIYNIVDTAFISAAVSLSTGRPYSTIINATVKTSIVPFSIMASVTLVLVVLWHRSPVLSASSSALSSQSLSISARVHASLRDAARAHRSTHGARQPSPLPRASAARASAGAGGEGSPSRCASSTSTASRGSTTVSAIPPATRCSPRWARGSVRAAKRSGSAATSSLYCFRGLTSGQRWPLRVDRRAGRRGGARPGRPGVGERRHRDVPDSRRRPRRADPRGGRRAVLGQGVRKEPGRAYRPDVIELAELKRIARGPDRAARLRAAASLARAVDARDTYTGRHSERVARLAASVATRMGLAPEEVELTRLAGSLHDLGKLAIPEEILRKPGPLTDPERMVLERHPQIGFRMLESLGIDPVSAWVLHHHERWDGTGYPDGLPGDAIPLGARIIFVADAFDAMTSERVYRDRLDASEALAELARCAGTQFDPESSPPLPRSWGSDSRRRRSSPPPRKSGAGSAACAETGAQSAHLGRCEPPPRRRIVDREGGGRSPTLGGGMAFGPWPVGTGPFRRAGGVQTRDHQPRSVVIHGPRLDREPVPERTTRNRRRGRGRGRAPDPRSAQTTRRRSAPAEDGRPVADRSRSTPRGGRPSGLRRAHAGSLRPRHVHVREPARGRRVEPVVDVGRTAHAVARDRRGSDDVRLGRACAEEVRAARSP